MKIGQIKIKMERKLENKRWGGHLYIDEEATMPVFGIERGEGPDRYFYLNEDIPKTMRDDGKEGVTLGSFNLKEGCSEKTGKDWFKLSTRGLKVNGLHFPATGFVRTQEGVLYVEVGFDSYYYDNCKEYWEGKREYVLDNQEEAPVSLVSEEIPF